MLCWLSMFAFICFLTAGSLRAHGTPYPEGCCAVQCQGALLLVVMGFTCTQMPMECIITVTHGGLNVCFVFGSLCAVVLHGRCTHLHTSHTQLPQAQLNTTQRQCRPYRETLCRLSKFVSAHCHIHAVQSKYCILVQCACSRL